jgi:hypothetical protein
MPLCFTLLSISLSASSPLMYHNKHIVIILLSVLSAFAYGQGKRYQAIFSGTPWLDDRGNVVSAHGGCIIKNKDRCYFFGECHADTSNAFTGFNCYSSADLYNWKFETVALSVQDTGRLGPNRVGERPKVMRCPATGEYVMFMHSDDRAYKNPCIGYATAKQITGPYIFRGALLFNDEPIKRWDMGAYQDNDGNGYILTHGGNIYKLSADYKSIIQTIVQNFAPNTESPAIFHKGHTYFWLCSHLTSWERNDNVYYTANSLQGPWRYRGTFAPEGTLTWNSQTTFVLPVKGTKDTTFMFMGDRWSFPHQNSSATYVWQPMKVLDSSLSIPSYHRAWNIDVTTGVASSAIIGRKEVLFSDRSNINYTSGWKQGVKDDINFCSSDARGAHFSVRFSGRQISMICVLRPDGGYAQVNLKDSKGKIVMTTLIDMYCKYSTNSLSFISPVLKQDYYTLIVTVAGEHGNWSDKRRSNYGSTGNFVSLNKVVINE